MKILILDSGVRKEHPLFVEEEWNGYSLFYDENEKNLIKGNDITDESGHGTAVYGIIRKKAKDAEIKVIKMFRSELTISEEAFCHILEYISENESPDIINLSLGINVCADYNRLYGLCEKIAQNGTVIISAFDNSGAISFPAAFDNVIGVDSAAYLQTENDFEFIDSGLINLRAKGGIMRLAWIKPDYIFTSGNSFACACITGLVAGLLLGHPANRSCLLSILEEKASHVYKGDAYDNMRQKMFSISNAAIFPFNKEMHSLIRYSHMLEFNISDVYDIKYSARVGASTDKLLHGGKTNYIIKDIQNISWDEIDTLILGHMEELSALVNNVKLREELIQAALAHGKNIYSFDAVKGDSKNIFYPQKTLADMPNLRFGKLYRIPKPVLAVFGTSSRQGKFTLQLALREKLQAQGYRVGQLGTEPSALLFGMDDVYPFGYNGTVSLMEHNSIIVLNDIMYNISSKENDIIIVGSQSGTVPYDTGYIGQYPIKQLNFLYGTVPDAVILCVNPHDEINYIRRTIHFIESAVDCKVIALCVFPMKLKDGFAGLSGAKELISGEEAGRIKDELSKELGTPALLLGCEADENILIDTIINFFEAEDEYEK